MQENEMILMDDDTSAEEKATAENEEAGTASEEEPKPKRTRRKKTEESVPEVTESTEVAENTEEDSDDMSLEDVPEEPVLPTGEQTVEELLTDGDGFADEEEPTETKPRGRNTQRTERPAPILTIEAGGEVVTEEMQADIAWHEIHNAYRTWRILSGTFGGLEQLDSGKYVGIVQ